MDVDAVAVQAVRRQRGEQGAPAARGERTPDTRTAIVTGASRGIGAAVAQRLSADGLNVALAGRDVPAMKAVAASLPGPSLIVPTDVTQEAAVSALVAAAVDHFGGLDVLVANSGVAGPTAPLQDVTVDQWDETFAVNVRGTFLCCRAAVGPMRKREGGRIVVVGSMTGKRPLSGRSPYAAAKMSLVGLVRTAAAELGRYNICVNLVSPGPVEGARLNGVIEALAEQSGRGMEEVRADFFGQAPLGRVSTNEDIADVVAYLGTTMAPITGQDWNVNGGMVMY